ncbi:MAG TPA: hypothetical protein VMW83_05150 [Spirochaetia bacterium]|nr:hypothetical protein [Spirochaetia bacterium]
MKAEDLPVREDRPLIPNNHYVASKAAGESLSCAYAAEGLHVVHVHIRLTAPGPARPPISLCVIM